jgi:hypothetical protein
MQKKEQTRVEQIVAQGHKDLEDFYNKKTKKSKHNKTADYVTEFKLSRN